jgi:2'-5' RNA ligase
MLRAFIGCRLDRAAHDRLVAVLVAFRERLARQGARATFTRPENLHVTVAFLGNIEDGKVADLAASLAEIARTHPPFPVRLEGLGSFPPHRPPRVVFADITEGRNDFIRLAQSVSSACEKLGFDPERRAFRPHVTLARIKPGRRVQLADVSPHDADAGAARIEHVTLYRSETCPTGPIYSTLSDHALGGNPSPSSQRGQG